MYREGERMPKVNLGILASGRGSNLQAIIDAVNKGELNVNITAVVSDNERAYALDRARANNIPAYFVNPKEFGAKDQYEAQVVKILQDAKVNLVALAGYMRLIGPTLLEAFPNRVLNIHPALLPSFPGLQGQKQALDYGVKYSGCTVHFVDAGMDTGPIIAQAVVPVLDEDNEETLALRILTEEHKLYPQALKLYAEGKISIEGRKVKVIIE